MYSFGADREISMAGFKELLRSSGPFSTSQPAITQSDNLFLKNDRTVIRK